jgi:hypothetical protein
MKKIVYLLSACVLGLGLTFTSCELEDEEQNGNNKNNNNNNNGGGDQTSDEALPFTVNLSYTSTSPTTDKASLDISSLTAVPASQGDLTLFWQTSFDYVITSPDGSILKGVYEANNKTYNNNKTTTVQNLGQVSLDNYDELSELNSMTVTSGSIPNYSKNQVQVQNGDVIAFQKGSVKGVAKVSGLSKLSKVTAKVTLKGYVNSSSSSAK